MKICITILSVFWLLGCAADRIDDMDVTDPDGGSDSDSDGDTDADSDSDGDSDTGTGSEPPGDGWLYTDGNLIMWFACPFIPWIFLRPAQMPPP